MNFYPYEDDDPMVRCDSCGRYYNEDEQELDSKGEDICDACIEENERRKKEEEDETS